MLKAQEAIIAKRVGPSALVSDNGAEFTSMAILPRCERFCFEWRDIAPGKPMQSGFAERFNRRFRDEGFKAIPRRYTFQKSRFQDEMR